MAQTRDQIQLSFGKEMNWMSANPVLLKGECACVFDNETLAPKYFTFGNGALTFAQLPLVSFVSGGGGVDPATVYTIEQVDALLAVITQSVSSLDLDVASQIESVSLQIGGLTSDLAELAGRVDGLEGQHYDDTEIVGRVTAVEGRLDGIDGVVSSFNELTTKLDPDVSEENYLASLSTVAGMIDTATQWSEAHQAALDSGVTAAGLLQTAVSITDLENQKASKVTGMYINVATVVSAGTGYSAYSKCTVGGVIGFITGVDSEGSILSDGIVLLQTVGGSAVSTPAPVLTQLGGSGATCTVASSSATAKDLINVQQYIEGVVDLVANTKLDKGQIDNLLRVIQGGQAVPIYLSPSIKYVDGAFTGVEQGVEFAPFKTGQAAISSFGVASLEIPNTVGGVINFAAGEYVEDLLLEYISNKTLVGQALSHQSKTTVNSITLGSGTSNIGIKNLGILQSLLIASSGEHYVDNVTVTGETSVDGVDFGYFENCSFLSDVQIVSGVAEFSNCDFYGKTLSVLTGATVVARDCMNFAVSVAAGASYVHSSGTLSPADTQYALSANSDATFVGLYSGSALTTAHAYAPINIPDGVSCALGLFLFDFANSVLPSIDARASGDGVSGHQVVVGARSGDEEGYLADSPYLGDHLSAISAALKVLADAGSGSFAITDVDLVQGEEAGELAIKVTTPLGEQTKLAVVVPGLGSAAFTDATAYATAEDGELAQLAYQKDAAGIPKSDLVASVQTSLEKADSAEQGANKTSTVTVESDLQYPTAGAFYRQALAPITAIQSRLPTFSGAAGTEGGTLTTVAGARVIALSTAGRLLQSSTNNTDVFPSFAALVAATTFYYQGVTASPEERDIATYIEDEQERRAQYDGAQWVYRETLGQQTTDEQRAALNSGVTAEFVADTQQQLEDMDTALDGKQGLILSGSADDILVSPSTDGGQTRKLTRRTTVRVAGTADDSSVATEAGVRSAIDTGLATRLAKPVNPESGSVFVKLKSDGTSEADSAVYLTESAAELLYLKSADASFQPPVESGTDQLLSAPATLGGSLRTIALVGSMSASPSDARVLTEKGVNDSLSGKQQALPATAYGLTQVPILGATVGAQVTKMSVKKVASDVGNADDILLTESAVGKKIAAEAVASISGTSGSLLVIGPASKPISSEILSNTISRIVEVAFPDPLVQGALTPSVTLESNTVYYSNSDAVKGLNGSAILRPVLQTVGFNSNGASVFSGVSVSGGEQSVTEVSPSYPSPVNTDALYLLLSSAWSAKKFNNSCLNLYLPQGVVVSNLAFTKSVVSVLHVRDRNVGDSAFVSASTLLFRDSTVTIQLDRATDANNAISVHAINSVIHAYGKTRLSFVAIGDVPNSATVYLHGGASVQDIPSVNSVVVYVSADSTLDVPVPVVAPMPMLVVDLKVRKRLSTEDYTTAEKTKLAGIAEGANNYTHPATHSPSVIAQDSTNRFMTDAERAKLSGVAAGAQVNVLESVKDSAGTALSITSKSVQLSKSTVGLPYVDNTADVNKPVSGPVQTALNAKAPISSPIFTGTVSGITNAMVGLANVANVLQYSASNLPTASNVMLTTPIYYRAGTGAVNTASTVNDLANLMVALFNGLYNIVSNATSTPTTAVKLGSASAPISAVYANIFDFRS